MSCLVDFAEGVMESLFKLKVRLRSGAWEENRRSQGTDAEMGRTGDLARLSAGEKQARTMSFSSVALSESDSRMRVRESRVNEKQAHFDSKFVIPRIRSNFVYMNLI